MARNPAGELFSLSTVRFCTWKYYHMGSFAIWDFLYMDLVYSLLLGLVLSCVRIGTVT